MPLDPLAPLLAAVFDPAAAPRPGRLRPRVVGWPRGQLLRLRRSARLRIRMGRCAI